jgi:hypothetical protein
MKNLIIATVMVLSLAGCSKRAPMKVGDSVCVGSRFLLVNDTESYPWVKMTVNTRCAEHLNDPDLIINVEKLESFNPSCICRYSAACRKQCTERAAQIAGTRAAAYESSEGCLDACEQNGAAK